MVDKSIRLPEIPKRVERTVISKFNRDEQVATQEFLIILWGISASIFLFFAVDLRSLGSWFDLDQLDGWGCYDSYVHVYLLVTISITISIPITNIVIIVLILILYCQPLINKPWLFIMYISTSPGDLPHQRPARPAGRRAAARIAAAKGPGLRGGASALGAKNIGFPWDL